MILYIALLLFSNFIGAVSQILLKKAASKNYKSFLAEYLNSKVIIAYFIFFLAVFIDLTALKIVPASYIPIIETSSYIFTIILSRLVFKDIITKKQILAMSFIIIGIIVYVI